jgi:hypothetical protein
MSEAESGTQIYITKAAEEWLVEPKNATTEIMPWFIEKYSTDVSFRKKMAVHLYPTDFSKLGCGPLFGWIPAETPAPTVLRCHAHEIWRTATIAEKIALNEMREAEKETAPRVGSKPQRRPGTMEGIMEWCGAGVPVEDEEKARPTTIYLVVNIGSDRSPQCNLAAFSTEKQAAEWIQAHAQYYYMTTRTMGLAIQRMIVDQPPIVQSGMVAAPPISES